MYISRLFKSNMVFLFLMNLLLAIFLLGSNAYVLDREAGFNDPLAIGLIVSFIAVVITGTLSLLIRYHLSTKCKKYDVGVEATISYFGLDAVVCIVCLSFTAKVGDVAELVGAIALWCVCSLMCTIVYLLLISNTIDKRESGDLLVIIPDTSLFEMEEWNEFLKKFMNSTVYLTTSIEEAYNLVENNTYKTIVLIDMSSEYIYKLPFFSTEGDFYLLTSAESISKLKIDLINLVQNEVITEVVEADKESNLFDQIWASL